MPSSSRERAEALAILCEVDRGVRRAEDPVAGRLDVPREAERRLAAELRTTPTGCSRSSTASTSSGESGSK